MKVKQTPNEPADSPVDFVHALHLVKQGGQPCADCAEPTPAGLVGFRQGKPLCNLCFMVANPALCVVTHLAPLCRHLHHGRKTAAGNKEDRKAFLLFAGLFDRIMEQQGFSFPPRDWVEVVEPAAKQESDGKAATAGDA